MKKVWIGMIGAAAMLAFVPETMARPHHGHDNDGLALAAGIVNLVKSVIAPAPKVVVAPAPAPVVVTPPPPPAPVVVTPPPPPAPVVVTRPAPVVVAPPPPRHRQPAPPRGGHGRGGHRR